MDTKSLIKLRFFQPTSVREAVVPVRTAINGLAIREAMIWCSLQSITAISPETPDTLRRRDLLVSACRIYSEMYDLSLSDKRESVTWKRAQELQALAHVQSLVLLGHQLRSPELKPPQEMWEHFSQLAVEEAVAHVITTRSTLLRDHEQLSRNRKGSWDRGRLLAYQPHENLADGAAEYSSNGFFDANNCPPWDTWVSYDGKTLTSFVPEELVPLAQAGIEANPEQCIQWAPG